MIDSEKVALSGKGLNIALWLGQLVAGGLFAFIGFVKLTTTIAELSQVVHWAAEVPEYAVRLMGAVDLAGGLGLILPAATRIVPRLTVIAALGCTALQLCAILFHLMRGEATALPLNFVLVALSAFILWGRSTKVRII